MPVTTFAGTGGTGSLDGAGDKATFNSVQSIAIGDTFALVADFNNHRIRRVDLLSKQVSTRAGSGIRGSIDGSGNAAQVRIAIRESLLEEPATTI